MLFRHLSAMALAVALPAVASGQGLVLTEYNAVGSTKFLQVSTPGADEGYDTWFGVVQGNGGNWVELVVTQDHLDVRGWQLRWAETGNLLTNGTDLWYGNAGIEQGIVTFSNDPAWSDLRAGTVLTICEYGASGPVGSNGKDIDFTFDPCKGDWWINAVTFGNPSLFTTVTNKVGDGPGNFSTGNNSWLMEIRDAENNLRMGQRGEGAPGWGGSGVNSQEVGKLKGPVSDAAENLEWDDSDIGNFGTPNSWGDLIFIECRNVQDLSGLRAPVLAECAACTPIFLNEYNAVAADQYLRGGTATLDSNGGTAADPFFGRVLGNGGNWFEMVVGVDGLDLRGWTFAWSEVKTGGFSGTITLSQNAGLASIPAGTIVTFIERNALNGGRNTDLTVNPGAGDRWMNIYTRDTSVVSGWTSTKPDTTFGSITTSNDEWQLEVRDASGTVVAGPFGEGAEQYWRGGVSATDVCHLRASPGSVVTMADDYDDTGRFSNFGEANAWAECPDDGTVFTQDLAGLGACSGVPTCPGDLDGSGTVDAGDIGSLLILFGESDPAGDLDQSGSIDAGDIGSMLILFGDCP
jgi:hypothetical protein